MFQIASPSFTPPTNPPNPCLQPIVVVDLVQSSTKCLAQIALKVQFSYRCVQRELNSSLEPWNLEPTGEMALQCSRTLNFARQFQEAGRRCAWRYLPSHNRIACGALPSDTPCPRNQECSFLLQSRSPSTISDLAALHLLEEHNCMLICCVETPTLDK